MLIRGAAMEDKKYGGLMCKVRVLDDKKVGDEKKARVADGKKKKQAPMKEVNISVRELAKRL